MKPNLENIQVMLEHVKIILGAKHTRDNTYLNIEAVVYALRLAEQLELGEVIVVDKEVAKKHLFKPLYAHLFLNEPEPVTQTQYDYHHVETSWRVFNKDGDAELGNWEVAKCFWESDAKRITDLLNNPPQEAMNVDNV